MVITAYNPEIDENERSYLSTTHAAGSSVLYVKNNDRFTGSQRILIGEMGAEHTEIVTTASVANNTDITLSGTTDFSHEPDDPVTVLDHDQVAFYRAATKDGAYTLVDTVPLDVDNADGTTRIDDPDGLTTSWYKVKYINSLTSEETNFSDPMMASGYTATTAGKVIDEVIRRVRDPGYTVLGVDEYLDIMNEVNNDLITQTHRPYRFLKTSVLLNTVADQNYVELPANLWKYDRLEYTSTIGGYSRSYAPKVISMEKWDARYNSTNMLKQDLLTDIAIDETSHRIYLGPTPRTSQTGKIELFYWKTFDEITSVGDEVETPNTLIYRYKMLAEYYSAKSESDNQYARLANNYEAKYGAEVVKMQRVNRMDAGTPREFKGTGYRRRYVL